MKIFPVRNNVTFKNNDNQRMAYLISQLGSDIRYPDATRNYCAYNEQRVNELSNYKEKAIEPLSMYISSSMNHNGIIESLFVVDKMIDKKTKNMEKMYPALSRFNQSQCPHIQSLLAGIYRKTQVPDAFGPLVNMLIKNSQNYQYPKPLFDPNEEIGGAILEYIKNYASQGYKNKV